MPAPAGQRDGRGRTRRKSGYWLIWRQARDTGKKDCNGWPIKVIDPPAQAIREIYRGANTRKADVERAVQVARGENKSALFVGHVSSHAFRIQKAGGVNH